MHQQRGALCVRAKARYLSPCGRGRIASPDAIRVRGYALTIDRDPSPQPSPTRGEGAHCRCGDIDHSRWIASLALAMMVPTRATLTAVIARLDRAIQYSRDASDGIEKPRRTGYPAGACH